MFGRKETEEERLIRTGQMTPFGTLVQNQEQTTANDKLAPIKLRRVTDGSSSASRWQTTEQDLRSDDNKNTFLETVDGRRVFCKHEWVDDFEAGGGRQF
ncbi:hypothetical protein HPB47_024218 [Ixodes persulcatus]|uniref:Uncharacterized protein n=1 Tax=Ixodes persulcatus TaxID=34615 RepID=A0AC60Q790_IXOPE|nr:hypothetical protein HPB47_024218 [Ixodes persulcatus]